MAVTVSIPRLQRWKRRFARATVLVALPMAPMAYYMVFRVADFIQGVGQDWFYTNLVMMVIVFFWLAASPSRYVHDVRPPWGLSNWGQFSVFLNLTYRYTPIIGIGILFQTSYGLVRFSAAHLLKSDTLSLEALALLLLLALFSICLTGVATTNLWSWYLHRRTAIAMRQIRIQWEKDDRIHDEQKPENEKKPHKEDNREKIDPNRFLEEQRLAFSISSTLGAMIVFAIIYLVINIVGWITNGLISQYAGAYWVHTVPYLISIMAGILGVFAGISAINAVFSSVRLRTVAWWFIWFVIVGWGIELLQLFGDLMWRTESPPLRWTVTSTPNFVGACVAALVAWKMTAESSNIEKLQDNPPLGTEEAPSDEDKPYEKDGSSDENLPYVEAETNQKDVFREEGTRENPDPNNVIEKRPFFSSVIATVGALIVFAIIYLIIIIVAFFIVFMIDRHATEYWASTVPYLVIVVAGLLGVHAGLSAVKALFSRVRRRTIAWIFIVLVGLYPGSVPGRGVRAFAYASISAG